MLDLTSKLNGRVKLNNVSFSFFFIFEVVGSSIHILQFCVGFQQSETLLVCRLNSISKYLKIFFHIDLSFKFEFPEEFKKLLFTSVVYSSVVRNYHQLFIAVQPIVVYIDYFVDFILNIQAHLFRNLINDEQTLWDIPCTFI